jgi:hypothetical protein
VSAEVFAKWLHRQGYHVIRTPSSYWYNQGPRIYQAFPYHWIINPTEDELRTLIIQHYAIGLRYSTSIASPQGALSYHVVCESPTYEMNTLHKKARYDVRKGLECGTVEQIPFSRLAIEGWELQADTLRRQRRAKAEGQANWECRCLSAEGLPGFEAWGLILNGELTASLIAFNCDNCCNILYQQSRTEYLRYGINSALSYSVTRLMLRRPHIKLIFYGLHSLDAPSTVDRYKFRLNYKAKPVRQRVVFHPWLAPFFNRASNAVIQRLAALLPRNPTLSKAEGMLRFYLEGKLPISQQSPPQALKDILPGLIEKET